MLQKNSNLIVNICEVQLKSAWGLTFPNLAPIYSSLSKIRWDSSGGTTPAGIQYQNRLTLSYPGLSQEQFEDLDKFIRGLYEIQVKTEQSERYQLAGPENPMAVEMNFNGGQTDIVFSHVAIEPIQFLGVGNEDQEPFGFPYYLTFNLA